ncbi:hypothetical protein VTN00DRAFT_600 [Thermoascus crustaceus]|uniref:uncharacterized protein n=1 Tax=Thermoascus crustaceus TaxID=5088 RepID=UPI003744248A
MRMSFVRMREKENKTSPDVEQKLQSRYYQNQARRAQGYLGKTDIGSSVKNASPPPFPFRPPKQTMMIGNMAQRPPISSVHSGSPTPKRAMQNRIAPRSDKKTIGSIKRKVDFGQFESRNQWGYAKA